MSDDPHDAANAVALSAVIARMRLDVIRRLATYIVHTEDGAHDEARDALTDLDWAVIAEMRKALSEEESDVV